MLAAQVLKHRLDVRRRDALGFLGVAPVKEEVIHLQILVNPVRARRAAKELQRSVPAFMSTFFVRKNPWIVMEIAPN